METHEPSSALSGRSITSLPTPTSAGGRDDERHREAAPPTRHCSAPTKPRKEAEAGISQEGDTLVGYVETAGW
jgi:hypothetical protein